MKFVINMKNITDRDGFHSLIEKTLPVPDYYGRNLDALYDFLSEKGDEMVIELKNCAAFRDENWEYMNMIEAVLENSRVVYEIEYGEDD